MPRHGLCPCTPAWALPPHPGMGSAPAPRWDSVLDPAEGSALGLPARDIVPCNPIHGVTLYKRQSLLSLIGTLCEKFFRSFFVQLEIGCADSAPRDIVPCNPIHGITLYKKLSLLSLIGTLREKFFRNFFVQLEIGCADSAPRDIVPCNPTHRVTLYKRQSLLSLNVSNSRGAHCAPDESFFTWFYSGEHCSLPTNSNHRRR